jgi:hypothetical protein
VATGSRWGRVFRVLRRFGSRGANTSSLSWSWLVVRGHSTHRCWAVGLSGQLPLVAARWPLPLPPRPLPVAGLVLEVFPLVAGCKERRPCHVPSVDLAPPSELSFCAGLWALLSWPCPLAPLHRHGLSRPLPGSLSGSHRPDHSHVSGPVPPSRFLTVLAASSARAFRVCFNPVPVRGSPGFRPGVFLAEDCPVVLLARLAPFEECPSSIAVLRHRSPCLLALVFRSTSSALPSIAAGGDCSLLVSLQVVGRLVDQLAEFPRWAGSSPTPGLPDGLAPSSMSPFHVRPLGGPTRRTDRH